MVKIEDPITLFLLLLIVLTSSLPVLIVASIFGFISIAIIFKWVTPLIPLFAFSGLGYLIYSKTHESNPLLATIIISALTLIGVVLTLYVGYGLFQPKPPGGW